jgi:hypothetical protein
MSAAFEEFSRFVRAPSPSPCRLVVANRTRAEPVQRLFEAAFADQQVEVGDVDFPGADTDLVVLVRDGAVVATSPLDDLLTSYLLVNSDRYVTGGVHADAGDLPAVLTNLDETTFEVRGYPATNKGTFLLIAVSRYIEAEALNASAGTLRATFQNLSRVDDEVGTRRLYERLAETDLDVHLYGHCGSVPADLAVTAHVGDHDGYRRTWCVVYTPPPDESGHSALVAIEDGDNEWVGRWTYCAETVRRLEAVFAGDFC